MYSPQLRNDVPKDLIFNWDQTGINLVSGALWTMDKKGKKQVEITGLHVKRQITAVMCGSIIGEILPPQLIYGGKTARCHQQSLFLTTGSLLIGDHITIHKRCYCSIILLKY